MLMPMHIVFLLCGTFLIPDIFSAAKSTEKFFMPEDYEEVQDYSENFKENVAEPLIIEEFETKQISSNPCQAKPRNIRRIGLQPLITCNRGPYRQLVLVPKSLNKFIWLTRCIGHVSERAKCQATKKEAIFVNVDGQCVKMHNETKCEEKCIKSQNDCTASQTFNNGRCRCEIQTSF